MYRLFTHNHWTAIYKRTFLMDNAVRYGETGNTQDTTFLLRVSYALKSIEFEDRAMYYYVSRSGSRMRDYTQARLNQELSAVREQLTFLFEHDGINADACHYAFARISYCLRLQETVAAQNKELGDRFLAAIKQLLEQTPYFESLKKNTLIGVLMAYNANLVSSPYRAQGCVAGIDARVRLMRNWAAFLQVHPWWIKRCRSQLRGMIRMSLLSSEMRACSRAERRQVKKEIHALVNRFPDTYALVKGSLSMTLFIRYGIDCFRQIDWLKRMLSAS